MPLGYHLTDPIAGSFCAVSKRTQFGVRIFVQIHRCIATLKAPAGEHQKRHLVACKRRISAGPNVPEGVGSSEVARRGHADFRTRSLTRRRQRDPCQVGDGGIGRRLVLTVHRREIKAAG